VLYASLDDAEKNAAFAEALGAVHPVVSDPDGVSARRYGVVALGGLYARRWTFYIDARGILRYVDREVAPATAGQDMVRRLESLGFPKRIPAAQTPRASAKLAGGLPASPGL
jgi:peroxiredoxin Q/BCP